ncbi:hypothetical protein KUTeg_021736 [Tegillarca granosa]|uniref:Peptidase S54 rhomboid domain-containing protein n=1 Tax=Tegillarca granosa TaxID=220873 RepID=A0ABQ9E4M8_TEGGR|nr:hypothetical protein KUTeg_021736 [Tegillarca granosa]
MSSRSGRRSRRTGADGEEDIELQDAQLRRELEEYGPEGLPLGDLREELEDEGLTKSIPEDRLNELLHRADHMTKKERSAMRSVVAAAIANIVPKSQREDFLANYNCKPPPIFMVLISIIEIIIFAIYAAELKEKGIATTATTGVPTYSPLIYKPTRRYEAWRYLTYMFIHQGYMHILFNLIFQLLLGLPLEVVHKFWRVIIIYIFGVLAAGASGGCYALIGAHLAAVITNWKEMNYKCCEGSVARFLFSAPVRLTVLIILGTETTKVGISAHIGGLCAGLLLGVPVLKNINELPWERTLGWITLAIYLTFVAFCLFFNGLYQGETYCQSYCHLSKEDCSPHIMLDKK